MHEPPAKHQDRQKRKPRERDIVEAGDRENQQNRLPRAQASSDGGKDCSRGDDSERDGRAGCEHRAVDVAISTRSDDGNEAGRASESRGLLAAEGAGISLRSLRMIVSVVEPDEDGARRTGSICAACCSTCRTCACLAKDFPVERQCARACAEARGPHIQVPPAKHILRPRSHEIE